MTFDAFWLIYPKRKGCNPKAPARTKWDRAIKKGVEPERIINSAKAYADELKDLGQSGTEFVCQAKTWLNQQRWEDYAPDPGSKERDAKINADMARRGYAWDGFKWVKEEPETLPRL